MLEREKHVQLCGKKAAIATLPPVTGARHCGRRLSTFTEEAVEISQ